MNTSSIPPWEPGPAIIEQIYTGKQAEITFTNHLKGWAAKQLRDQHDQYELTKKDVGLLVKRAFRATLESIRRNRDPKPNLLERMLHDQVLVHCFQKKMVDKFLNNNVERKNLLANYRSSTERYIRKYMKRAVVGPDLSTAQEKVLERSLQKFYDTIEVGGFVLRSSLTTYLLGITNRQIKISGRSQPPPPSGSANLEPVIPLNTVRFLQQAHRLIARQLFNDEGLPHCKPLLLAYYGLDTAKIDQAAALPTLREPLTQSEFAALFSVGADESREAVTLERIAQKLGLSAKQASKRHLICLDELVEVVVQKLVTDPSLTIPPAIKQLLHQRVQEVHHRQKTA